MGFLSLYYLVESNDIKKSVYNHGKKRLATYNENSLLVNDIVKDYEIVTYRELIKKYSVMANTVVVLNEGSLRFEFNCGSWITLSGGLDDFMLKMEALDSQ